MIFAFFQEVKIGDEFRVCWTGSIFRTSDLLSIFQNCSFKFCFAFKEKQ